MKNLYFTNKARESAIKEIDRLINVLGDLKSGEFGYIDYRSTVKHLNQLKDVIKSEIK